MMGNNSPHYVRNPYIFEYLIEPWKYDPTYYLDNYHDHCIERHQQFTWEFLDDKYNTFYPYSKERLFMPTNIHQKLEEMTNPDIALEIAKQSFMQSMDRYEKQQEEEEKKKEKIHFYFNNIRWVTVNAYIEWLKYLEEFDEKFKHSQDYNSYYKDMYSKATNSFIGLLSELKELFDINIQEAAIAIRYLMKDKRLKKMRGIEYNAVPDDEVKEISLLNTKTIIDIIRSTMRNALGRQIKYARKYILFNFEILELT